MPATKESIKVPKIIECMLTMSEGSYCVIPLCRISCQIPIVVAMIPENNAARIDLDKAGFSRLSSIIAFSF
jgi:hypothetical protein